MRKIDYDWPMMVEAVRELPQAITEDHRAQRDVEAAERRRRFKVCVHTEAPAELPSPEPEHESMELRHQVAPVSVEAWFDRYICPGRPQ